MVSKLLQIITLSYFVLLFIFSGTFAQTQPPDTLWTKSYENIQFTSVQGISGGGFIGGLLASGALGLYALAHGSQAARSYLPVEAGSLAACGVGLALFTGIWNHY